jgi:hypothetical protein
VQEVQQLRQSVAQREERDKETISALQKRVDELEKYAESLVKMIGEMKPAEGEEAPGKVAAPTASTAANGSAGIRSIVLLSSASTYNIVIENNGQVRMWLCGL